MATKKMTTATLIRDLQALDKGYFTIADLEKITGQKRESLKVFLHRLTAKGILTRIKRGVYQLAFNEINLSKIANQLYYPSYLSFESALSSYGILSQIPYTQTFATIKRSKKLTLWHTEVEYRQIHKKLFWGFTLEQGMYIAEKEKAILDQLYMVSRGKGSIDIEELDLRDIDKNKLEEYAKKFPPFINTLLDKIKKYIGTTPITLESQGRIILKSV